MAGMITAIAYTFASLGQYTQIPARIIPSCWRCSACCSSPTSPCAGSPAAPIRRCSPSSPCSGIGYVMITRLEPDRLAGLQTTWSIIAIVAFVLTLAVVQRAADLARYRWTFLFLGVALLVLPLVPGVGSSFGGARIWVSIGRSTSSRASSPRSPSPSSSPATSPTTAN